MRDEKLIKRIRENAAELERLHSRISPEFRNSDQAVREKVDWEKTYREWYESYDALAFPGGLRTEFARLQNGDSGAVELAIQFLLADPWYFRSGYYKEDICRLLRKQTLTDEQCFELRKFILERVTGRTTGRLMRAYARLAVKVTNGDFEAELSRFATLPDTFAARRAQQVIAAIQSQREARGKANRD